MSEAGEKYPQGGAAPSNPAQAQPGMGQLMREVSRSYYYAYYAAKYGNWRLAAHQLGQMRGYFRTAKAVRPKYASDLDEFDRTYVVPILKAIQAKDWTGFESAYSNGIEGSDFFHMKYGYDYIKFILPESPPSDLHLGPPEEMKREKDGNR
jgi:hypothetical protein